MFHTLKKTLWALMLACCLSINFLCVEPNNIASAHPDRQSQLTNHELTNPIELGAFIDGIMADQMSVNHIPGAIVSVVEDGHPLFEKGYGFSDYENQVPVDPQRTLFRVGSVSKLFVWTVVMQLVEQGKLSLDADINMYLDFKIPATYPQPVTMRNLLIILQASKIVGTRFIVCNLSS